MRAVVVGLLASMLAFDVSCQNLTNVPYKMRCMFDSFSILDDTYVATIELMAK